MGHVAHIRWWRRCVAVGVLAAGLALGTATSRSQVDDPPLVFGTDAGIVLTFVRPDQTEDFERVLGYLEEALRQSENPVRRQQAENWQIYRSSDPGPNGAVFYVSFMEPVLKGANYNITHILDDELPAGRAEELVGILTSSLAQGQSMLSLDSFMHLKDPPVETVEEEEKEPAGIDEESAPNPTASALSLTEQQEQQQP